MKYIVCISHSFDKAKEMYTIPLKRKFETSEFLACDFPDVRPATKWTEDELEFTNGVKVIAKGRGQSIRGTKHLAQRPNIILIDDLEDEEAINTSEQRQKTQNWFDYDVEPALARDMERKFFAIAAPRGFGKSTTFFRRLIWAILNPEKEPFNFVAFIGTVLHDDSMLNKLIKQKEDKYKHWEVFKFQALTDERSIWPQKQSTQELIQERQQDIYKFSREKQNDPIPIGVGMFRKEYFKTWDKLPENMHYFITVDLACTDKTYSDYTVIMVTALDSNNNLYVIEYTRQRYVDPDTIIKEILRLADKYPTKRIGIEKTNFQRFLIVNFQKAMRERDTNKRRYVVQELNPDRDKTRRIATLQPWFSNGYIFIRYTMADLQEELLMFPRATHDDVADALAYVVQPNFLVKPSKKAPPPKQYEGTMKQLIDRNKRFSKLRRMPENKMFSHTELYEYANR